MSTSQPKPLLSDPRKRKRGLLGEILALEQATNRKLIAPSSKIPDVSTMGAQLLIGGN